MLFRLLAVTTCVLVMPASLYTNQPQTRQLEEGSPSPLEIRFAAAPQWEKDCLKVSVDRTNRSSATLFLPVMGLYIATSVDEVTGGTGNTRQRRWVNVWGASDILSWEAAPIVPAATVHDEECLHPQVPIVNLEKESRRLIPLRGTLKVDATYYLTKQDWQTDKQNREEMLRGKSAQWDTDKIARQGAKLISVFAAIPCREPGCYLSCSTPPLVLHGEDRAIPDVFGMSEWAVRGTKIADDFAQKSPACSESIGGPQ
jgi:hypothetical protein